MGYLDNTSTTVDAILTKKGRELLARGGDEFKITKFALGDDEIDYGLWDVNHQLGSNYYGQAIEAMPIVIRKIPDATLSVYGSFRTKFYKDNVCETINRLNMNESITLHAHILHADMWKKLEDRMIGVIPFNDNALTRIGTPTKIFEFMAAGCQIVCPDLPPMKRYDIKGLNFFQSGNVESLSNVLINSMKNISNKDLIYNQEKVKSVYNWDCISDKLINLYNRLLS